MPETTTTANRARIVDWAARLLQEEGPAAVTTRGVASAAGVQAPTIYRLFGDKDGLLEAVAEHVMTAFVAAKAAHVDAAAHDDVDPVEDLRSGWQAQVEFGLANPALFRLLSDPARVENSVAAQSGRAVLERRIHRVARAGRLRVSEERAVGLIMAAGVGAITTFLATPEDSRDPGLADALYEAVLAQILTDAPGARPEAPTAALAAAVTLRAVTPDMQDLSEGERALLVEWLDRIVSADESKPLSE